MYEEVKIYGVFAWEYVIEKEQQWQDISLRWKSTILISLMNASTVESADVVTELDS